MRRLAWTFAARISVMYQIRLTRSIWPWIIKGSCFLLCFSSLSMQTKPSSGQLGTLFQIWVNNSEWMKCELRFRRCTAMFCLSFRQYVCQTEKENINIHLTKVITFHPIVWQLVRKIKPRHQRILVLYRENSCRNSSINFKRMPTTW